MKKGFTLIELLAVIVILAIIALIATPIILGIINDARKESNERSIELYIGAVRNGVAAYQLRTGNKVEAGTYDEETLPFEVEVEGNVECETIEIKDSGEVSVSNCTVNGNKIGDNEEKEELPIVKGKLDSVCKPAKEQLYTTNPYESGYKYECKVDPNKDRYTFYVLNSDTTSVNLIMDNNIMKTGYPLKGTETKEAALVVVEWISKNDYISKEIGGSESSFGKNGNNNKGPITAMNWLQTVTINWTNVIEQTVSTFTNEKGITCTMGKTSMTHARLPYISEVLDNGCKLETEEENNYGTCPLWLVDNMNAYESIYPNRTTGAGAFAYWTLSSTSTSTDSALAVFYPGNVIASFVSNSNVLPTYSIIGVRPVINLSK